VQDILSERMQKKSDGSEGMWPHYRVKWQSVATGPDAGNWSDDQHDTHEPLDYLPGCEDMINAMQRARDGANAAMDAAEAERREEKKRKRAAAASAPAGEGSEEPGEDPDHLLPLRAKNGLVRYPRNLPRDPPRVPLRPVVRRRVFSCLHSCDN
jgi:hypothetical protein